MKIDIRSLPEGRIVSLSEDRQVEGLDLNMPGIRLASPLEIKADIIKIQDTVDIKLNLRATVVMECSRCLNEIASVIERSFRLDCLISKEQNILDITDGIREEIILGYPLKPLCKASCKGLCLKCGKNLNEGECGCKIT